MVSFWRSEVDQQNDGNELKLLVNNLYVHMRMHLERLLTSNPPAAFKGNHEIIQSSRSGAARSRPW